MELMIWKKKYGKGSIFVPTPGQLRSQKNPAKLS